MLDMRVLVPVAIPMALALVLGMVLAGNGAPTTRINQAALGAGTTAIPAIAAVRGEQNPTPSANAAAPAAAATMNCTIVVPDNPLSAAGLATPWQLTGPDGQSPAGSGCQQSNPNNQAFVQATILDPATGALSVYQPLVTTLGTQPAVAPVTPQLPANAVVNIMVGFNGTTLQLAGAQPGTLANANCVNGLGDSLFGQVAYCNSAAFYAAANNDIAAGTLHIPANGTSPVTGQQCPTTRSFDVVDQDPSDNVTTQYLLTGNGQTAQDNAANTAALAGAMAINNGSDNRLLDNFLLPALGCAPLTAPDLSAGGAPGTSQTLDELSAMANQQAPVALVPLNDPMTLVNGQISQEKTNLYRIGVGQPLSDNAGRGQGQLPADAGAMADATFCATMLNQQSAFIAGNMNQFANVTSPVPAMGNNLFTFMAARLSASFTNLNCANFGLKNPVTVTADGNGVAVAAAFNLNLQVVQLTGQPQAATQATAPAAQNALTAQAGQGAAPAGQATGQSPESGSTSQTGSWWQQFP